MLAVLGTTSALYSLPVFASTSIARHESGYSYMYKDFKLSGALGEYGRMYENNINTKIIYDIESGTGNYKVDITFCKVQAPGWVTLKRNDGVISTFYTTDGSHIKVGRFSVDGKHYCSDMLSGELFKDKWVLNGVGASNLSPQGNPPSLAFNEYYDINGILQNNRLDALTGENTTAISETFTYSDGTGILFSRNIVNGKAKVS